MSTYEALYEFASGQSVVNTHSHYQLPEGPRTLDFLMENSYVRWLNVPLGRDAAGRTDFLERVRHNTYFTWLERALQKLHGFPGMLTEGNWEEWSEAIANRTASPTSASSAKPAATAPSCWTPTGTPARTTAVSLFTPTFRINSFLYGYDGEAKDHNGNNALRLYGEDAGQFRRIPRVHARNRPCKEKAAGCVALKCASAYDRPLDFKAVSKERAARAYQSASATPEENPRLSGLCFL